MDVTSTAKVIETVQSLQSGGLSPDKLVIAAGIISSHIAGGVADKIPTAFRPLAIALGSAAITAGAAVTAGTPWQQALGYGVGSAAVGKLYHLTLLKDGSLLSGLIKAFTASTPPTSPKV